MSGQPLLSFDRVGTGPPLLLIHGIGHRRQMWQPIIDRLAPDFDCLAVDLPGFGDSAPVPRDHEPTPEALADTVAAVLASTGWQAAHLVGNSLGCWIALELARRGLACSVTALMPAGLWRVEHGSDSQRQRLLFAFWSALARLPGAELAIRSPLVRTVALAGLFGRPWRVPADVAAGDTANLRRCDLPRTMQTLSGRRFTGGTHLAVPVTVALGSRDPLIRPRFLDLSELPAATQVVRLRGTGHVPTWDDPDAVTATIRASAQTSARLTCAGGVS